MSLLSGMIEEKNANGELELIYNKSKERFGFVPNAIKMQSINPDTIKYYAGLSSYFTKESTLGEKFRMLANEIIAQNDNCEYCISLMEGVIFNKFGITTEQLQQIRQNPSQAPLEKAELTLLEFILKVLKDSNSTTKEDVKELNQLGIDDKQIFDAINFATQMQKMHIMLNALKINKD